MKTDNNNERIISLANRWAKETAQEYIAFLGEAPFKGLDPTKAQEVKEALVFYAQMGATETVRALIRHGNKLTV